MTEAMTTITAPQWVGSRAAKHEAILAAAATVFRRRGYLKANLDEVAELAEVSKRTVYKHFSDKDTLFTEAMLGILEPRRREVRAVLAQLADTGDVAADLRAMARRLVRTVATTETIQLRRVVVAEAERFPDLAANFLEQSVHRHIDTLAAHLATLTERGVLRCDDPVLAAQHLNWLVLGVPVNDAMFTGEVRHSAAQLERFADEGVAAFLRAYGAAAPSG